MKFINWPAGLSWTDGGTTGHWWWPWKTPLFVWHEGTQPLVWVDDTGVWHRLTTPTGKTDFGSIPGCVQWIPGLNPLRFKIEYVFHDDAYRSGYFLISTDQGATWNLTAVSEQHANERLREQIPCDPADPGNELEADTIYAGVQMGGWMSWKKGGWQSKLAFIRARRMLLASRRVNDRIDPYGSGGILRPA